MNTFITPTWVTKDVATFWKNSLKLVGNFTRQWDDSFRNKPEGAQIGYTVQARLPQRFVVNEGQALVQQAILNQTIPITINHQQNIGMGWSSADASLEVEEVQERYTMPAGEALANKVDVTAGAETYAQIYYSAGSPGVPISDNATYLNAVAGLQNVGVPGPYVAVLDPLSQAAILGPNLALFNPSKKISDFFDNGVFSGPALGVREWSYDPNMPIHTTGSFTSCSPAVNGANQTGSSLITDLWASGATTLNAGDTFTIAGVNAVNPVSYADTGTLQSFVVQATISDTSGAMTISIAPSIITSGQLQTVTASPADDAAITVRGATGSVNATLSATASRQSYLMNPDACAFVMADLKENLAGARTAMARSKSMNLSMRWAEQYNIQTDQNPSRVDIIYGTAVVLPYFAQRMWS